MKCPFYLAHALLTSWDARAHKRNVIVWDRQRGALGIPSVFA